MSEKTKYTRQVKSFVKRVRETSTISFPSELTEDVLDFLDLMLTIDPYQRPSAADLLRHPFFTSHPVMVFSWPSFISGNGQELQVKEHYRQRGVKVGWW